MKVGLKLAVLVLVTLLAGALIFEAVRSAMPERGNFAATDLQGRPWSLAEHRGRGPVVVNFFETWCSPCAMERPELVRLQAEYADRGLKVVLVTREPADVVRRFPDWAGCGLTLLTDAGDACAQYDVSEIPHTVFFDARGEVVKDQVGYSPAGLGEIEQRLKRMPVVSSR